MPIHAKAIHVPNTQLLTPGLNPSVPLIGKGLVTQNGPLPPPKNAYGTGTATQAALLEHLQDMSSQLSIKDDDVDAIIASLTFTGHQMADDAAQGTITMEFKQQQSAFQAQLGKLADAQKQIEQMLASQNSGGFFGSIAHVFEDIGAAISIACAVLTCWTGVGGAAFTALAIALIVISSASLLNSVLQSATGMGIGGNLCKLFGGSAELQQKFDMGFTLGLAALSLIISVVMLIVNPVGGGATIAANLKQLLEIGKVASCVTTIVGAASSGIAAGYNYDAANHQAASEHMKADADRFKAVADEYSAAIDQLIDSVERGDTTWTDSMNSISEAAKERGDTLAHAHIA